MPDSLYLRRIRDTASSPVHGRAGIDYFDDYAAAVAYAILIAVGAIARQQIPGAAPLSGESLSELFDGTPDVTPVMKGQ